jgi:hypothetical protein
VLLQTEPHTLSSGDRVKLSQLEEVKTIGGSKSVTRTAEQSEIARYWYENSPRGWNRIAREVSAARQFDVWENARLFALVNLAMARFFNTDFISFSMTSGAPYPGITRKFWSFSEAARENGASPVAEKAAHKLPTGIKTMNAIEVVQRYNKAWNGRDAPSELER